MLKNKILKIFNILLILFSFLDIKIYGNYKNPDEQTKQELLSKINAGIPKWMTNQINADLANAPKYAITNSMLDQILDQDPLFFAKFSIKNGQISFYTKPDMPRRHDCLPLLWILEELNNYIKLPDVDFLYNVDDAPYCYESLIVNLVPPTSKARYLCPVLASTKHINDINVIPIPDYHTFRDFEEFTKEIVLGNAKYPWKTKKAKAFWRGSTTGGIYYPANYHIFPRVKLVQLSKKYPDILDAKFNKIVQDGGNIQSIFTNLDYIGNTINISDHIQYKYQILIDGNSAAWTRCWWQLHSNSVILKQNSNYLQWYHELLKPYVHYIPFDYFCSDLIEKIQWAQDNDKKAQEIVKNANLIAEHCLQYSDLLLYIYAVITSYAKLLTFEP